MIKFLRALPAILALSLAGYASAAVAQPAPAATSPVELAHPAVWKVAHPAVWKVTGPHSTIYLFGTVHLLPANVRWFDGTVAQAFGHADTLVTEILEPTPEAMRSIVAAKAMLPAGSSLRDMLAPDDRQHFEAVLTAQHVPVSALDRLQPWSAAVTLAVGPMLQLGYDPANGVDRQLGKQAAAANLPHEALETMEFQIGLFAGLPPPLQKTYLLETIKQLPELKPKLAAIIQAWEDGRADELARLMNADESDDDPQLMKILLSDRNRTWAKWIQARLAKPARPHETLFIAVGAGHLAGPGSVQDDLRALGIASQRLR